MDIKTYPEMNKEIVGLLRLLDTPTALYAAARIEELETGMSDLLATCEGLVKYRDRAGALNFQLEKADDFIHKMRAAIAAA